MNTQEYLDQVLQVICECFRPTDPSGSMPVATAAYLVRQRLGVDHCEFGFAKFKDVLSDLEGRGLIRTGSNTKQAFALWLIGTPALSAGPSDSAATVRTTFRPLRKPVWFAFVSESPSGRRFLNRVSGEVRVGLQEALGGDWVEIVPITVSTEKEEAIRFLATRQLESSSEVQSALQSPRWYVEFPEAISKINPQIASEWKRQRSNRVTSLIEKWRSDNSVSDQLLFERERPSSLDHIESRQQSDLRRCLLSAIQRMPTEELLDLDIPPRLLIAEIRPDLLDK